MTKLKGMTWSHSRGYDPMVACSKLYREKTGTEIEWDKRSLQDFESFPVEELARAYDLIVIDHPHVGQITAENCLEPLDIETRKEAFADLAMGSVGRSFPSYHWQGRQWAFPIDAAAQVQAWRPDLIDAPPQDWWQVMDLARHGMVHLALRPPHSLMTFFTIAANTGTPCAVTGPGDIIDNAAGAEVFEKIRELATFLDPACFEMDPIAISEDMAKGENRLACSPYIYGYLSYAIKGFRENVLKFSDIPVLGDFAQAGSALGGTGIAVSAFSKATEKAVDFAYWIASAEIQSTLYAASGGQPGHAAAWEDDTVNAATGNFYRDTRATLEGAWLRPRHDGYMNFQHLASQRLNEGLKAGEAGKSVVADINRLFAASFC